MMLSRFFSKLKSKFLSRWPFAKRRKSYLTAEEESQVVRISNDLMGYFRARAETNPPCQSRSFVLPDIGYEDSVDTSIFEVSRAPAVAEQATNPYVRLYEESRDAEKITPLFKLFNPEPVEHPAVLFACPPDSFLNALPTVTEVGSAVELAIPDTTTDECVCPNPYYGYESNGPSSSYDSSGRCE